MGNHQKIREMIVNDGKITKRELEWIKDEMAADGKLDFEDARFLIEILRDADEVCSEFDDFFFPCLRHLFLQDGQIGMDEQFLLLEMLYSDGEVRDCERRFLKDLYREVDVVTPEFQRLCETALNAPDRDWKLD
jgi:uncharacterized tellurite resistance protein B-like protein